MCLAIPAQVEKIHDQRRATVVLDGNRTDVLLALVPEAKEGDWVLVHAGYAITVLDAADAKITYDLLAEMGELEK
ncbi:MAG: HypC/HybG/HupF family hydrogenase formation chaperone [Phycisphaerae bacterium]|jgi:hydrogenase expression/formation protein HypC